MNAFRSMVAVEGREIIIRGKGISIEKNVSWSFKSCSRSFRPVASMPDRPPEIWWRSFRVVRRYVDNDEEEVYIIRR